MRSRSYFARGRIQNVDFVDRGRSNAENRRGVSKGGSTAESGVTVSEESIRAYLEDLNHRGRREETVRFYAAKLKTFYDYLPPDKQIVLNTLETWRQALLAEGYAPATVNTNISAANGLLDYLGRRDLQLTGQLETETAPQSELTRTEYLRLLSAARALEKERTYLLVKAIALTGAHVGELPQITVEAVQSGRTPAVSGGEQRRCSSPEAGGPCGGHR